MTGNRALSLGGFGLRLAALGMALATPTGLALAFVAPEALAVSLGALVIGGLLTFAGFGITQGAIPKSNNAFMGALLGAMALKMLVSIGAVTVLALIFRPHVIPLVLTYFSGYLAFTAFEVWALLNNLRANSPNGRN